MAAERARNAEGCTRRGLHTAKRTLLFCPPPSPVLSTQLCSTHACTHPLPAPTGCDGCGLVFVGVLGGGAHRRGVLQAGWPVNGGGVCGAVKPDARGRGAVKKPDVPGAAIRRNIPREEAGGCGCGCYFFLCHPIFPDPLPSFTCCVKARMMCSW